MNSVPIREAEDDIYLIKIYDTNTKLLKAQFFEYKKHLKMWFFFVFKSCVINSQVAEALEGLRGAATPPLNTLVPF